jgi:hypothetical protein
MEDQSPEVGHGVKIAAIGGVLGVTALVAYWLRTSPDYDARRAAGAGAAVPDLNTLFQSVASAAPSIVSSVAAAVLHAPASPAQSPPPSASPGNAPHAGKSPKAPKAPAQPAAPGSAPKTRKKSSLPAAVALTSDDDDTLVAPGDTSDDSGVELFSS